MRTELLKFRGGVYGLLVFFILLEITPSKGWAVVGQAEQYSEFQQADLEQFQKNIAAEETNLQMNKSFVQAGGRQDEELDRSIRELQSQLLQTPERRKVRFEGNGKYQYDSNVIRAVPRQEKDDSQMDTDGTVLFDLSGKRTDLRWELNAGKHWSVEFPEGDFWTAEERLRYRRRYFKKLQHSMQSRIARNSSKTVEINAEKVRWDSVQISSMNYPITKKLSLNQEMNSTIRYFHQEAFDQDSSWEVAYAPSAFWNFTPKTRGSLGYRFAENRIRTKSGDSDSHEVHAGYFGKITQKSSASLDLSFSHQVPKSRDTAVVNTVTSGVGYIWQMSGKTQLTVQLIRSQQNSTSDLVEGSADSADAVTVKTDNYFTNNSLSLSLNSRLSTRLTTGLTFNGSHVNTKVLKDGNKDSQTTQFMFPFTWNATLFIKRWIALTMSYTFTYRTGYEKADRFRDHLLQTSVRIAV